MATHLEASFELDADPAQVVATMTNPSFIEGSEKSRGALSVRVVERSRDDAKLEYEVHVVKHAHSVTGIDTNKTEENHTEFHWDLETKGVRWVWHGPHGPKVRVQGFNRVVAMDGGAKLHLSADIEIGIPVVGKVVERKIKAGFEEQWPSYVRRIRDHLPKV